MLVGHRWVLIGILSLPILSGCGSTSHGSESGTIAPTGSGGTTPTAPVTPPKAGPVGGGVSGSDNKVSATASVGGPLVVAVGASQTISVTFTSTDGLPISGFSVYGSFGALPAGWSAPSSLTCAVVGPGSGCVLTLSYAPTAVESGTLTLDCVYVDNAGLPRTPGPCMTLAYAAAAINNVVASVSPIGEIDVAIGAKQTVNVNFTTDDGNAATRLTVTNLGALPTGWSSTAAGLSCAVVSTGSGCQVPLVFAPTAAANGTLTLSYSYVDGSGAARSGALNVPYATTTNGIVVASVSPTGQVNAAQAGGSQSVAVTFTTANGGSAAGFRVITDLSKLPAGWSSTSTAFSCASVSTGNGCQLQLQYAPAALTAGTLSLRYGYNDASGTPNFGVVNIPYAATTNDNVDRHRRAVRPDHGHAGCARSADLRHLYHRRWPSRDGTAVDEQSDVVAGRLEQHREFIRVQCVEQRQRVSAHAELCADRRGQWHPQLELLISEQCRRIQDRIGGHSVPNDHERQCGRYRQSGLGSGNDRHQQQS